MAAPSKPSNVQEKKQRGRKKNQATTDKKQPTRRNRIIRLDESDYRMLTDRVCVSAGCSVFFLIQENSTHTKGGKEAIAALIADAMLSHEHIRVNVLDAVKLYEETLDAQLKNKDFNIGHS